jgi:hypothetical protein
LERLKFSVVSFLQENKNIVNNNERFINFFMVCFEK